MPDHTCTQKKKENQNQLYHTLTFSQILHQSNQLDVKEEIVAFITYPQNTQHTYLLYIFFHNVIENSFIGFLKF